MDNRVLVGDCRELMAELAECSVDAIVTDPPYGLSFMGKGWDHGVPGEPFWAEALRVAKPGAPLLAFGGTRTYHRLACAIEDAGWEIRDCLSWLYGSGFPKSLDVSKSIDKAARGVPQGRGDPTSANHGKYKGGCSEANPSGRGFGAGPGAFMAEAGSANNRELVESARRWGGWGTALKPAWEPIILAMKPLDGTFAANAERWGVAGLNVEGCRVGGAWDNPSAGQGAGRLGANAEAPAYGSGVGGVVADPHPAGRFPANLVLDEAAAARLDADAGERPAGVAVRGRQSVSHFGGTGSAQPDLGYPDAGGPSRFFYTAKASSADRNQGCGGLPAGDVQAYGSIRQNRGTGYEESSRATNHHPTVKPRDLMRWLCTLVLPPKRDEPTRTVLDPFAGTGSTGIGAWLAGWDCCILIERDPEYAEIAERRVRAAAVADAGMFA